MISPFFFLRHGSVLEPKRAVPVIPRQEVPPEAFNEEERRGSVDSHRNRRRGVTVSPDNRHPVVGHLHALEPHAFAEHAQPSGLFQRLLHSPVTLWYQLLDYLRPPHISYAIDPANQYTVRRQHSLDAARERARHLLINPAHIRVHSHEATLFGGYGVVQVGEIEDSHGGPPQRVAIKTVFLRPQDNQDSAKLSWAVMREVTVWKTLCHPNVVALTGYIPFRDHAHLISPWQANGNAYNYVLKYPNTDRLKLIRQAAAGLAYLHTHNPVIIHGDLKAENVVVDLYGTAKLIDFGLSVILDQEFQDGFRSSRGFRGTVRYADPVLLDDKPKTTFTDLYAFGWTAWEIATSQRPYAELGTEAAVVCAIVKHQVPNQSSPTTKGTPPARLWPVLDACWDDVSDQRWTASRIASYL